MRGELGEIWEKCERPGRGLGGGAKPGLVWPGGWGWLVPSPWKGGTGGGWCVVGAFVKIYCLNLTL